jgi:hypothetical protein
VTVGGEDGAPVAAGAAQGSGPSTSATVVGSPTLVEDWMIVW